MSDSLTGSSCMDPGCADPGCGGFVDQGALVVSPLVTAVDFETDAYAVAMAVSGDGRTAAAALGDGTVRLIHLHGAASSFPAPCPLPGMPLCLAADAHGGGFLIGCDEGSLMSVSADGGVNPVSCFGDKWVEHLAVHPGKGLCAVGVGKAVHVLDADGSLVAGFTAKEGSVTGVAFSPDGTKVAGAHYNGVTAWDLVDPEAEPLFFEWKGAHTAVAWSPNGRYIVSATQENELHAWDMETGRDMRMSGYPAKVRNLSFSDDSAFLAAAGADTVTSWPFEGGGPQGRAPLELGFVFNGVVTRVACHPTENRVAAGYSDGTVLIGDIVKGDAITAKAPGGGPVTALCWTPDGDTVIAGSEEGAIIVLRVADA